MFVIFKDYHVCIGGYLWYIGGCSVHWGCQDFCGVVMSILGGVQYVVGISLLHWGNVISTSENIMHTLEDIMTTSWVDQYISRIP